jgi:filamentous hemagglutinin family protein
VVTDLRRYRVLLLSGTVLGSVWAGLAAAGPNGGTVVGGSATILGQGTNAVTINQSSQNAIINWMTFNIGRGDTTTFNQPNSSSVALNRVIGGLGPSFIDGTLKANGRVFIVNGDGILFGPHSSIVTAGFLATTNNIRDADFMAGKYNFNIPGLPSASIVNLGSITATSGGFAALVAPGVRNSGTITATLGTVSLAAGNAFTLDFYGDRLITLAVNDQIASQVIDVATGQPLKSLVGNDGNIHASGGRVELTASAARAVVDSVINNSGVIEADTIGSKNGMIVLGAATGASKPANAPVQTVKLAGTISAAGRDKGTKGGTVVVSGESIALASATIDASGAAGGGKVLIGGDTGGGKRNPAAAAIELAKLESFVIPTATSVSVDAASMIKVSAIDKGDGGKVVLWSDQKTTFAGTILARGGAAGGNGGFVETSGHKQLNYTGVVDLRAPLGKVGTLLLDPADYYIVATLGGSPPGASEMTNAALQGQLALGDVTIATNNDSSLEGQHGDIFVSAGLTWTSSNTLTLSAFNNININAAIAASNGGLTLNAGSAIKPTAAVNVATFTLQRGNWTQVTSTLPAFSATDFRLQGGTFLRALGGDGSSASPYQITDVYGLQGIASASLLNQNFVLANNIDASGTVNWNSGAGFVPIGTNSADFVPIGTNSAGFVPIGTGSAAFIGSLDGARHTIDKLTIVSSAQLVGLFGRSNGVIRNLGLTNASVTTTGNSQFLGVLAGANGGSITNSYTTGKAGNYGDAIPADGVQGAYGGLVGLNDAGGVISNSHSSASVHVVGPAKSGYVDGGGLVGQNHGTISLAYAQGSVTGENTSPAGSYLGGLVGWNLSGKVEKSYASGSVTGTGLFTSTGGLIGVLDGGSVTESYASGSVSGTGDVGGLVGYNGGSITQSYATGNVTGGANSVVGGLVGTNSGTITETYASGAVTGGTNSSLGGLVGSNNGDGNVTLSYWDAQTTGQVHSSGSLDSFGLTTAAAMKKSSYAGWKFDGEGAVWFMIDGQTRPFLRSEWSTTITNSHQLQLTAMQPNASYTLANNVSLGADLNNPSSMWGSAGFVPIGNMSFEGGFTGTFDGQNHTIDQLTIAPTGNIENPGINSIGLFAYIGPKGVVQNLNLTNVSVTANPNVTNQFVGTVAGLNAGTIKNVSVTGVVNGMPGGISLAGVIAGGLVGQNGAMFDNNATIKPGTITGSFANVNVTVGDSCSGSSCNGGQSIAGGLVGFNSPTSTIADSVAIGNVTAGASASAGGLVGQNFGTIIGTTTPGLSPIVNASTSGGVGGTITVALAPCRLGVAFSCASGSVHVGSLGHAGGLAGDNDGIIKNVLATGAVTGGAGLPPDLNNNFRTQLGGLVGSNQGRIQFAFATGLVGSTDVAYVQAGGLVGNNHGLISDSAASGAVGAGHDSQAGGLTGGNDRSDGNNSCGGGCLVGDGDKSRDLATVISSFATGDVTVGDGSIAGGLSGTGTGIFSATSAIGNVTGGANSVLGGLVGAIGIGKGLSSISLSFASKGTVMSTGPHSVVGGLVGLNGGWILGSGAAGPVVGTSQSYLGGLVGINLGLITDSLSSSTVTGQGAGNFAGGVAGANFGMIDPTKSSGNVTSGANSVVGGLVGANGAFINNFNFPPGIAVPGSFPVGTISADSVATGTASSSGPGSTVGPQVGENYPTAGLPAYPGLINNSSCNDGVCIILATGVLTNPNPLPIVIPNPPNNNPPNTPPPPTPTPPETALIRSLVADITLAAVALGDVVNTQPLNQPPPGPPHTGSGTPPAAGGLPPQFGSRFFIPPPLGETRFIKDEVVLQIPANIPLDRLKSVLALMGLSILGSQDMGLLGVTSYKVHIDNGASIASVIQALARYQIVAGAQANYTYGLVQEQAQEPDLAGLTQGEGDAAQYAIGKLGLIDIHRRLKGGNISVAVIDSQIDVQHPDLDGVVAEQFDAVGEADKPHAHGTGMAGAIFSHRKLMGIAPLARLYAIHAFSSGAASAESTTFNILKGLEWASSKGVRVINMSFAGPKDPSLERALKSAHDKGIVLIAAAGNAGPKSPPLYPGADPNVIAVTATDVNDKLFSGANRGRYIAVAAPGVDILVPAPENTYQLTTGTSVASAEVSGLAALLLERNPTLTPEDVRQILTSSAHRLSAKDRDDDFGSGLIDPSKAIQTAGDLKPADITATVAPRPAAGSQAQPASRPPVLNVGHPGGTGLRPIR